MSGIRRGGVTSRLWGGVMLRIRVVEIHPLVGPSRNIQIHGGEFDQLEYEHLLVGEIQASDISFDFGKTWTSVTGGMR